jgi:hypothetical protein
MPRYLFLSNGNAPGINKPYGKRKVLAATSPPLLWLIHSSVAGRTEELKN